MLYIFFTFTDLMVRSELIEQIPSIALFCKEHYEDLGVVIRQQIVPYTVKLLTDIQRQVTVSCVMSPYCLVIYHVDYSLI